MNKTIKTTEEQMLIIREEGNIVVTAKPGSGKTYTIVEKILEISKSLFSFQGVISISFTRKASQELEVRYKRKNSESIKHFFGTIDSFYICEIIIPFSKSLFDNIKPLEVKGCLEDYPEYMELNKIKDNEWDDSLENLLKKSLQEGLIFLELTGETALYILKQVPQCLIYLKARYTHIFIDEYQDCGKVQHEIFMNLVDSGIKGIAVGDLDQAIFGFNGKHSEYLLELINETSFNHLQITKNHRCHESISEYSLALLGVKQQENLTLDKRVFKVDIDGNDRDIISSIEENLETLKEKYNISKNSDFAILCRSNISASRASESLTLDNKLFVNTALDNIGTPWAMLFNDLLLSYYLYKIDEVTILSFVSKYINEEINYKDFSKALRLVEFIFKLNEDELKSNIKKFQELANLIYPDQKDNEIMVKIKDVVSCNDTLNNFKPATDNQINVMTLHKSKGLEFKCVFLLDLYRWVFPQEGYWVTETNYIQSLNLHYVGITRAIDACYILLSSRRYRSYQKDFIPSKASPFLFLNNVQILRENLKW